jgi:hypothetical protein
MHMVKLDNSTQRRPATWRARARRNGYRDAAHRLIPLDDPMANDEHVAIFVFATRSVLPLGRIT